MSFTEIIGQMGVIGSGVVACLLLLSVYSIGVMIDRFRRFRAARSQSLAFLPVFARCLKENKLQEAINTSRSHDRSHLARVVTAGVTELVNGSNGRLDPSARVAAVSRALDRASAVTSAEMRKGLGGLATIGSTAPFVGLFGTVVGIIHAFQGIAATGSGGLAAVSGGIAEALVATAFGLFVAIPAVMAFNYFTGKVESFQVEMANVGAELIDFVIKQSEAHATR
jgi:biopolymer transport protein ExbB/biopolymer transport protein TolQ